MPGKPVTVVEFLELKVTELGESPPVGRIQFCATAAGVVGVVDSNGDPVSVGAIQQLEYAFGVVGTAPSLTTSYARHSVILWSGTDSRPQPTKIEILVEPSNASRTWSARVFDVTNGKVIAEATGLSGPTTMTVYDLGAIANVPSTEAVWEFQFKRPTGGGSSVSAHLGFVRLAF